ncbi:MAG: AhpC/TSA family protein [Actinobacteria bacterium]|nr:AhpC/TSA family protein [Actinomycetota bacterium]
MLSRKERLDDLNAVAIFVVHDQPELVRRTMLADLDVPFPIAVDIERVFYDAWGLGRGSLFATWLSPRVWLSYGRLLVRGGERYRGSGRDTLQLGGDFVIDSNGVVAYARPQRRDDRPPVAVLLRELDRASSG